MTTPPKEARSEGDGEGGMVEQPAAKRMKLAVPVGVAGGEPEAAADPAGGALPGARVSAPNQSPAFHTRRFLNRLGASPQMRVRVVAGARGPR